MKKIFIFFVLVLFLVSCKNNCESEIYNKEGICCSSICTLNCRDGYEEGSCGCLCKKNNSTYIDDIFGNDDSIKPPPVPE